MEITKSVRTLYLYEKQDKKCFYCHQLFFENGEVLRNYTIDHMIPSSKGGKDTLDNICLCCADCNSLKGNLSAQDFVEMLSKVEKGELKLNKKNLPDYVKYLQLKSQFEPYNQ